MSTPGVSEIVPAGASDGGDVAPKPKGKPPKGPGGGRGGRGRGRGRGGALGKEKGKRTAEEAEITEEKEPEEDKKRFKWKGSLAKDLRYMMYGFGDAENPLPETVDLVEELTIDYLTKFAKKAMEAANRRGRLQTEDLLYVIRHDEKKLARCMELLEMNEQLKEARKNFDTTDAGAADAGDAADE